MSKDRRAARHGALNVGRPGLSVTNGGAYTVFAQLFLQTRRVRQIGRVGAVQRIRCGQRKEAFAYLVGIVQRPLGAGAIALVDERPLQMDAGDGGLGVVLNGVDAAADHAQLYRRRISVVRAGDVGRGAVEQMPARRARRIVIDGNTDVMPLIAVRVLVDQPRADVKPRRVQNLRVRRYVHLPCGHDAPALDEDAAVDDPLRENQFSVYNGFHYFIPFLYIDSRRPDDRRRCPSASALRLCTPLCRIHSAWQTGSRAWGQWAR